MGVVRIDKPKWCCPKFGSWDVANYDPDRWFLQMRVYCKKCGFYGCRDGDDDGILGDGIETYLYRNKIIKQ